MNRKVASYASSHNMSCDERSVYGIRDGYQVSVDFGGSTSSTCIVSFYVNLCEKLNEFLAFLEMQKRELKIEQTAVGEGVHCAFKNWTVGSSLAKADKIIQVIVAKLTEMGVDGSLCPYCNQPMETSVLVCDGIFKFRAHEGCFDERLGQVQQVEVAQDQQPNNYLKGILGAVIGSLAGGVLFAVLYALGFLAALSSAAGAVCASWLYSKFGGKNNWVKIVSVAVSTLIVTVLAYFLCNVVSIAMVLAEESISADAVQVLIQLLETDKEVAGAFWGDFIYTIVFYIVGIVYVIVSMVKEQKKVSSQMKKMQ